MKRHFRLSQVGVKGSKVCPSSSISEENKSFVVKGLISLVFTNGEIEETVMVPFAGNLSHNGNTKGISLLLDHSTNPLLTELTASDVQAASMMASDGARTEGKRLLKLSR